jgi:hypothetical protein
MTPGLHFGHPGFGWLEGHQIWFREVAVVMGMLLGAHFLGNAGEVIPARVD